MMMSSCTDHSRCPGENGSAVEDLDLSLRGWRRGSDGGLHGHDFDSSRHVMETESYDRLKS